MWIRFLGKALVHILREILGAEAVAGVDRHDGDVVMGAGVGVGWMIRGWCLYLKQLCNYMLTNKLMPHVSYSPLGGGTWLKLSQAKITRWSLLVTLEGSHQYSTMAQMLILTNTTALQPLIIG